MNKPLLDRSCRPVSREEDQRIRMERMFEPPVYLESALGLTVEERIAIEVAEETGVVRSKCVLSVVMQLYKLFCCDVWLSRCYQLYGALG